MLQACCRHTGLGRAQAMDSTGVSAAAYAITNKYYSLGLVVMLAMQEGMHVHGMCMACTWHVHGACMARAWRVHGVCMACTWRVHGVCMACAWRVYALPTA